MRQQGYKKSARMRHGPCHLRQKIIPRAGKTELLAQGALLTSTLAGEVRYMAGWFHSSFTKED